MEGLCEVSCCVCYPIFWVKAWEFLLHWEEFRRVRDSFQCCLGYVLCKTLIIYHCQTYMSSLLAVWFSGAPIVRFVVH